MKKKKLKKKLKRAKAEEERLELYINELHKKHIAQIKSKDAIIEDKNRWTWKLETKVSALNGLLILKNAKIDELNKLKKHPQNGINE